MLTVEAIEENLSLQIQEDDISLTMQIADSAPAVVVSGAPGNVLQTIPDGLYVGAVQYVQTIDDLAQIEAGSLKDGQPAQVVSTGRAGLFRWQSGDLSAECAADPLRGIYVPADGGDGSGGAWVRQFDGASVQASWFRASEAHGAGREPIQAAIDSGYDTVINFSAEVDAELTVNKENQRVKLVFGATILAVGNWGDRETLFSLDAAGACFDNEGTVDCNNMPISAVRSVGFNGVKIRPGTIKNTGWVAIFISGSEESKLTGVVIGSGNIENSATVLPGDGWAGIRLEHALSATIDRVTLVSQNAKGISLSRCEGCKVVQPTIIGCTGGAGIYFARGANNECYRPFIRNADQPVKFSRSEKSSALLFPDVSTEGMLGGGYATVLFQGTSHCEIVGGRVSVGTFRGIAFETHPEQASDPFAHADSIGNKISGVDLEVTDAGVEYPILFQRRSDTANRVSDGNVVGPGTTVRGGGNCSYLIGIVRSNAFAIFSFVGSGSANRGILLNNSSGFISSPYITHDATGSVIYAPVGDDSSLTINGGSISYGGTAQAVTGALDIRYGGTVEIFGVSMKGTSGTRPVSIEGSERLTFQQNRIFDSAENGAWVQNSVGAGLIDGNVSSVEIFVGGAAGVTVGENYVV